MTIHHPVFGEGEIRASRYGGLETLVAFHDGLDRWVRTSELPGLDGDTSHAPRRPARIADGRKDFDARRMIEAFRLGIVPHELVDAFTFGRDGEIEAIQGWLAGADPALLLLGRYGSGKTHLLQHTYAKALREGFAVASVQINAGEAPFHNPKRVYRQIVRSLRFGDPTQPGGFREFVTTAVNSGHLIDARYFTSLLDSNDKIRDIDVLWEWIEARESAPRPWLVDWLPGLYDYSTAGNQYCYLLSALGWSARKALGLKGLLILFDEAEAVDSYWYGYQLERADSFLRALLQTAANRRDLLGRPSEVWLTHCRVGAAANTPFLYRVPSGLKLLFAFTDTTPGLYRIPELRKVKRVELETLDGPALKRVFAGVQRLYKTAYPSAPAGKGATAKRVMEHTDGTRSFVKASVEALDLARFA